jgi:hypothetical protein
MPAFWNSVAEGLGGSRNIFISFISYRHDDSAGEAGRLFDRLSSYFPGRVFRDVSGIDPGANFADRIDNELARCRVFIVLIGKRWLNAEDEHGRRRLDLDHDWVRIEVSKALQRNDLVIPVLTGGAPMPTAEQLPPDLQALAFRQAEILNDDVYFDYHVQRLVECLERYVGRARKLTGESKAKRWSRRIAIAAGGFVLLCALIGYAEKDKEAAKNGTASNSGMARMTARRSPL